MKKNKFFLDFGFYLLATFLTAIILFLITSTEFIFNIPLIYTGDVLFNQTLIKSILDTHSYHLNSFLGAPGIYNIADFPINTLSNYIIVLFSSFFSHDASIVLNAYYFSTYFFVAWASLFVFQKLGIQKIFSLVACLLFTFIPYHLMRGEAHFTMNVFFAVPLYVFLLLDVFQTQKEKKYFNTLSLFFCILAPASSAGAYFSFFACFLLLIAGITVSIDKKIKQPLQKAGFFIAIICLVTLANVSPKFISTFHYGPNLEITRAPQEAEGSPLKISQLLFPVDNHHIPSLKNFKEKYNHKAPLVNENTTSSLGIIGSLGFLILIAALFSRRWTEKNDTIYALSILNISLVLLCTLGGFGTLFSYLISPFIRSYNRASLYIAFFSLCAFFILLQHLFKNISNIKKTGLALFLLVVGLWDQIPNSPSHNNAFIKETFSSDKQFVNQIEKTLPPQSMIFQLPYGDFPEGIYFHGTNPDEQLRMYLHSHHLHFIFLSTKGRSVARWQADVSKKPLKMMIDELIFANFSGLVIYKKAYTDRAFSLVLQLNPLLKTHPLISKNGDWLFYDLRPYQLHFKKSLSKEQWEQQEKHIETALQLYYHWKTKKSLLIFNYQKHPVTVQIHFKLKTQTPRTIEITGDLINEKYFVENNKTITKNLTLLPGKHKLIFKAEPENIDDFTLQAVDSVLKKQAATKSEHLKQ